MIELSHPKRMFYSLYYADIKYAMVNINDLRDEYRI